MKASRFRRPLAGLSVAVLVSCGGGGESTGVKGPASFIVSPNNITLDAVGATQTVTAYAKDDAGMILTTLPVTWTSSSAAVKVVGAAGGGATGTGTITAMSAGTATITAVAGGVEAKVQVEVAQVAVALERASGDQQTGTVGAALPTQVSVKVLDRLGAGVAGKAVTYSVTKGSGTVSSTTVTSGSDGTAPVTWTLGQSVSSGQELTATIAGSTAATATVKFNATASSAPAFSVVPETGYLSFGFAGSVHAPSPGVAVLDKFGNPVSGVSVVFAVTAGGGQIVGGTQQTTSSGTARPTSWTLGATPGANTMSATVAGLAAATLNVTSVAGSSGAATLLSANDQIGVGNAVAASNPSISLKDGAGNAIVGVPVTFQAITGGSVTSATTVTNASGTATIGSWMLGTGLNVLTASVGMSGITNNPVTVRAVGCLPTSPTGFAITLCITSTLSASEQAAFTDAAARWSQVITADLPEQAVSLDFNACIGSGNPKIAGAVDDVLIFAAIDNIDGAGAGGFNTLAFAGSCGFRPGAAGLPAIGVMRFDRFDLPTLTAGAGLSLVILHEMGHVLGLNGSQWFAGGLLGNVSGGGANPPDTYFSGVAARAAFDAIGGTNYPGLKVPVENGIGPGSANHHWRETIMSNELMTPLYNPGSAPLSIVTIRALQDIGYTVNPAAADPFTLSFGITARIDPRRVLLGWDDVYNGPQFVFDKKGNPTRIR